MKKIPILILLLFFQFSFAQESEIQITIGKFFNAFHQRDSIALKKVCSENLVLHSISESEKGSKFSIQKASDFYKSIATIPLSMKFEEKILSFKVQIDGSMAHVWTPYEFYVNDKLSHSGVNSFQLYKENEVWKVVYILDTRRKNN
ncbi:nuclear transport factor 2 family protein [Flavobacterium azooxidireducens]|uniref:Nuclear transport factor 2 family protein n=1 Tax=Flavobacterium azooxidireducens TaxID=1871076 RepID=A0ABY4KI11_9FLAO|nr:nuclear transport factor 2 family protein [Flavobacterium azooxidireducens]UPQ79408.1 nuclear transport factor 2 family protein [Flavobacterium azooxidireducens]